MDPPNFKLIEARQLFEYSMNQVVMHSTYRFHVAAHRILMIPKHLKNASHGEYCLQFLRESDSFLCQSQSANQIQGNYHVYNHTKNEYNY